MYSYLFIEFCISRHFFFTVIIAFSITYILLIIVVMVDDNKVFVFVFVFVFVYGPIGTKLCRGVGDGPI